MPIKKHKHKQRIDSTALELRDFLARPRPDRTLFNGWLYDGDIEVPSTDLLAYFIAEMLYGSRRSLYVEVAARDGSAAAISCFVETTRDLDPSCLKRSVEVAIARLTLTAWWDGKPERAHWWLCKSAIERDHGDPLLNLGVRRIAHLLFECLSNRAVFKNDWKQAEAMAAVLKAAAPRVDGAGEHPTKRDAATEIALQIFLWYGHLRAGLGRTPSRSEIQEFITQIDQEVSTRKEAWIDGRRMLAYSYSAPRKIRSDTHQITKLARLAKGTGPQAPPIVDAGPKLLPKWERRVRGLD